MYAEMTRQIVMTDDHHQSKVYSSTDVYPSSESKIKPSSEINHIRQLPHSIVTYITTCKTTNTKVQFTHPVLYNIIAH